MNSNRKPLGEAVVEAVLTVLGRAPRNSTPDRRMTVHTANNSFTGTLDMQRKGDHTLVGIETDDGEEYVVPYESIEYMSDPYQEDSDQ